ncbi:hypothetical protein Agabi119p4_7199 [Agaricus bisporus var. burnettii]|uniref:Uncharacterized protein n=1 Tax=Agaricus bisporus var. burnettii TaxID=192524 RepID=A0A8H7C7N5_AGABI|nr:hypothetical protein Agabi119p4_7199 [Agaricus bisporus var. burnettii]
MYLPILKDTISNTASSSAEGLSTQVYDFFGEHLSQVLFVFCMLVIYVVAGCDRWFELRARERESIRLREISHVAPASYGTTTPSNAINPGRRSVDSPQPGSRREVLVRQKPATPKVKNLSPLPVRPLPSPHIISA